MQCKSCGSKNVQEIYNGAGKIYELFGDLYDIPLFAY